MHIDRRIRTSIIAIFADLGLTLLRIGLAVLTGSAALMADAYHSGSDLLVSVVFFGCVLLRVWQERKGCDKALRRAKRIESLAVIAVACAILLLPYQVIMEADRLSANAIDNLWLGVLGVSAIILAIYFMARLKTHVGKQTDSLALEADGYHSMVDLFTSIAVLLSLLGMMIGIDLDEFVAVLIALLIGFSGFELLISGIRSLVKGEEFDKLSLGEWALDALRKVALGRMCHRLFCNTFGWFKAHVGKLSALALLAYFASGLTVIPYGDQGIEQQLGRTVRSGIEPGLHYHLPWPWGQMIRVSHQEVRSLTVGSERSSYTRSNGDGLWFEIFGSRAHRDNTNYLQTGDENLIFLELALQYRLLNASDIYHRYDNVDELVQRIAEGALWQQTAQVSYEQLLEQSHSAFSEAIAAAIHSELDDLGIENQIVGVQLQKIQPPASLVEVYRDVLNAHQESQDSVNQAIASRLNTLPMARAGIIAEQAQVESRAVERTLRAEGDALRFSQLAEVYQQNPQAFQFELQLRSAELALSQRQLTLVDPRIDQHDFRVWAPWAAYSADSPFIPSVTR
ncbi:protease modulator HflK family protein [Aliagarivorans marinus]|uniref:protease modulator HflK family protein n=1 Tax=Aliagarivorans marinus TaxID=561965 RepID=UPI0003FB1D3B|nr:protease modulator HflK family protein [Aliagarivorans marinus]